MIVNNRHWGMIYRNQIFRPVAVGDRLTGYVRRITEDNRIESNFIISIRTEKRLLTDCQEQQIRLLFIRQMRLLL